MSSSSLIDEKVSLPSDDVPELLEFGTSPQEPRESFRSIPDIQTAEQSRPKARCLFAVSPDLAHSIRTVSQCAVSFRNTLALVTSGAIAKESQHTLTEPTGRHSDSAWPPPLDKPSRKRNRANLRKDEALTSDGDPSKGNSGKISTVYCCDLERPWRLFPVFDVPGEVSIVSWSACGDRLLLCTDVFCYVISSKHSALNSWRLLNKARVTSSTVVHASWTRPLTTFVYCPEPTSESYFDIPVRPKISLSSDTQNSQNNDGFFVVSRTGEIVLVDIVQNEGTEDERYEFVAWKGSIEGQNNFNAADAVYDFDEQCFLIALASPTNPDVICVTFSIPANNPVTETNHQGEAAEGISVFHPLEIATATKLHTKNNIISLKIMICTAKIKFLLAATKTFEHDYLELWELSTSDTQKSLLDDPAIVPSDKPTWTLMATQELPEIFQCWTLATERFLLSDINTFFTVSVALRGGIVGLFTIKLGLEVTISEAGQAGPLQATQYTRGRNGTKKSMVSPEAAAFVMSANGCLAYMVDSACRLWAIALPISLWPIANMDDMLEVFLTVELDFSDLMTALPRELCSSAKQKLEALYEGLSPSRKKVCSSRYQRLKSCFSGKMEGRLISFVPLQSLLYDAVLVYLEQFVDMRDAGSRTESSMFQLTEFWSAVQKPDTSLEQVSTVIRSNLLLGSDLLRLLLAGFHVILHEIVSLLELVSREPQLLNLMTNVLPKLRAILSLVYVWTSSIPSLRQFFTRSTFAGPGLNVIEIIYEIVSVLMSVDQNVAHEWTTSITDRLDEANLRRKSTYHEWAQTFQQAEPRASCLKDSPSEDSLKWMHYTWSYSFLPSHSDHSKERAVVATGEPDTETFNLRPSKRKYCSRCFYSFPWRPTPEYTGTWHSHVRHRWSTCFCGGAWIFLE